MELLSSCGRKAGVERIHLFSKGMSKSNQNTAFSQARELEWLEAGLGTQLDVCSNLVEIERINRYLGGFHSLTRYLFPLIENSNPPITVMDIGTGSGGLLEIIQSWSDLQHKDVRTLGVDISPRNLDVAKSRLLDHDRHALFLMDGSQPSLRMNSIDFVVSCLVLHHFSSLKLVGFLRSAYRVSRHGLVMSDLIRGQIPLWAYRLVGPAFARHPFTFHDGLLSIRRAYKPAELLELCREAGLPFARVYIHFPWRMTLVVEK
jgi:ubiquinone/menaquinone biosynthesis C-methylase UbiE